MTTKDPSASVDESPASASTLSIEDVRAARRRFGDDIRRTPVRLAPKLAEATGAAAVVIKLDNVLPTGAFKERGALNALKQLSAEQRAAGVVTASAGNHAQALAFHAQRLGVSAKIVMPTTTPRVKIAGTAKFIGADNVVEHGETFDDALAEARRYEQTEKRIFVHPFDDAAVIAGQGTSMLELLEDAPNLLEGRQLDVVAVPIGGGGLIAGALLAAEGTAVEILGVEPVLFPCMWNALCDDDQRLKAEGSSIAEGAAVKVAGLKTAAICKDRLALDQLLQVSEADIEEAIVHLATLEKTVAEGAGALGLAAMLGHSERFKGRRVGLLICGGNIDARLLGQVFERHLVRQKRWARIRVVCLDQPGYLSKITAALAEAGSNVMDVTHNRLVLSALAKETVIDFIVETESADATGRIVPHLNARGFTRARLIEHQPIDDA